MYKINPTITLDLLKEIWTKVSGRPSFWEETDGKSFDLFIRNLVDSSSYILFDYGLARIEPGWSESIGSIHAVFWDRKVVRSLDEIKQALIDVAESSRFYEFVACVPASSKGLRRILLRLGFRQRGEINRYYDVPGGYQKAVLYGILKSEVQNGR